MTQADKVLAIDIGGTKVAAGLVNQAGELTQRLEFPTQKSLHSLVNQLHSIADSLIGATAGVLAVGLGVAGKMAADQQNIIRSPNLPFLDSCALPIQLTRLINRRVVMDNDTDAALLAEVKIGAGQNKKSVLLLTLGTGIGGAIYRDKQILKADDGTTLELGHTVVDSASKLTDAAGHRGDIEALLGAAAIRQRFGRPFHESFSDEEFVKSWSQSLNQLLTLLNKRYQPEIILLGGGVGAQYERFVPYLDSSLPVKPVQLGKDATIIGAGLLAWESLGGKR